MYRAKITLVADIPDHVHAGRPHPDQPFYDGLVSAVCDSVSRALMEVDAQILSEEEPSTSLLLKGGKGEINVNIEFEKLPDVH